HYYRDGIIGDSKIKNSRTSPESLVGAQGGNTKVYCAVAASGRAISYPRGFNSNGFATSNQKLRDKPGVFGWCARRESNPHGLFIQGILSPSRLPIPPLARTFSL